jgi:hypothetical protein
VHVPDRTPTEPPQVLAKTATYDHGALQPVGQNAALPEQNHDSTSHRECALCVHEVPEGREATLAEDSLTEQPDLLTFAALWASLPPELREVVLALPALPQPIKAGIVAMVRTAIGGNGTTGRTPFAKPQDRITPDPSSPSTPSARRSRPTSLGRPAPSS